MGTAERKEREKKEMQKLILDTARDLFLKDGVEKVSMREIAKAIEYNVATLYLYFKDKNEILYALHNLGFEEFYRRQQVITTLSNPLERLYKAGEIYLTFALENPEYYELMLIMREPAEKSKEKEDWVVALRSYQLLEDTVRECFAAGFFKDKNVSVEVATLAIWSQWHGIVSLIIRERLIMFSSEQLKQMAQQVVNFVLPNLT